MTLDGVAWALSAATDLGVPIGDVEVSAFFDAGRVSGHSGCNHYSGAYTVDGDGLTFAANMVTTMMACPEPEMAVERAYLARLAQVASFTVDGATLTLRDAAGAVLLVFDEVAGERAVAGDWTVTALRTADAVSSPDRDGPELTLSFGDGRVGGHTGCNRFNGRVTVTGQHVRFGPLATTRRACLDAALARQEQDYLTALGTTATFSATRSTLTLLAADGTITVSLTRSAR